MFLTEPLKKSDIIVNRSVAKFIADNKEVVVESLDNEREPSTTQERMKSGGIEVYSEGIYYVGKNITSGLYEVLITDLKEKPATISRILKHTKGRMDFATSTFSEEDIFKIEENDIAISIDGASLRLVF